MSHLNQIIDSVIKKWSEKIKNESTILVKAKKGSLTQGELQTYIGNLYYIFLMNTDNLKNAIQNVGPNLNEIKEFYKSKYLEEYGHHEWAEKDMSRLGKTIQPIQNCKPITHEILKYIETITTQEPVNYLAYIMAAEKVTTDLSEEFLDDCVNKCGLSLSNLTSVSNHLEADKAHTAQNFDFLQELPPNVIDEVAFKRTAEKSCELIYRFLDEVVGHAA